MDPTLQTAGNMQQASGGGSPGASALQNALLLQAIKGGASGGAMPPPQTGPAMGAQQMPAMAVPAAMAGAAPMGATPPMPMPPPTAPTNPATMAGGLGQPTSPMGTQMPMMQSMGGQAADPTMQALFSQIPGGQ